MIMVFVFGAFVFSTDRTIKMIGLGMATAVFLDAILVRTILVPAIMHVLGDRNWWLPEWLNRHLPHLDIEGEIIEPPRAEEMPVAA
jgi:RND superfamily putative drug exporter